MAIALLPKTLLSKGKRQQQQQQDRRHSEKKKRQRLFARYGVSHEREIVASSIFISSFVSLLLMKTLLNLTHRVAFILKYLHSYPIRSLEAAAVEPILYWFPSVLSSHDAGP
jgi:hypothetical protein